MKGSGIYLTSHSSPSRFLPSNCSTKLACCPHGKDEGCSCRKPLPGMLYRARDDFGLRLFECYVVKVGCYLKRRGKKHDIYTNPKEQQVSTCTIPMLAHPTAHAAAMVEPSPMKEILPKLMAWRYLLQSLPLIHDQRPISHSSRLRGPSNSQKRIPCQVPRAGRPFATGTRTELPIRLV